MNDGKKKAKKPPIGDLFKQLRSVLRQLIAVMTSLIGLRNGPQQVIYIDSGQNFIPLDTATAFFVLN